MASVRTRKLKNGKTAYYARWRDEKGASKEKGGFRLKSDARRYAVNKEASILTGTYVDPRSGKELFRTTFTEWHGTRHNLEVTTRIRDESYFSNHIDPYLGDIPLDRLTTGVISRWVADLGKTGRGRSDDKPPLSAATVGKDLILVRSCLSWAVRQKKIGDNPAEGVSAPKPPKRTMRLLRADEIWKLAAAMDERYRLLVLLAAFLGLRSGEVRGLMWEDVDLEVMTLTVRHSLREPRGKLEVGPTKSNASRRTLSLPKMIVGELQRHSQAYPSKGFVTTTDKGHEVRKDNFRSRVWLPAVEEAGLEPLRFHDLRHTCAALLIEQNVNPKTLQEVLGHDSISTTFDTYGHLMEGLTRSAADALDEAYGDGPWDSRGI